MMTAVQYACAKIGLVTGRGLPGVLRRHYSRWLLYPAVAALFLANTINVGVDVGTGMLFSNLMMFFVMLATGATLHVQGHTQIGSATEAAEALRPVAGNLASMLLGVGLIGGGVLAVPILSGVAAVALIVTTLRGGA